MRLEPTWATKEWCDRCPRCELLIKEAEARYCHNCGTWLGVTRIDVGIFLGVGYIFLVFTLLVWVGATAALLAGYAPTAQGMAIAGMLLAAAGCGCLLVARIWGGNDLKTDRLKVEADKLNAEEA